MGPVKQFVFIRIYLMTDKNLIKKLNLEYSHLSHSQMKKSLCGTMIGCGVSRTVFQCKIHPSFVVKAQYNEGFDNVIEKAIWESICKAQWWSKWFAECIFISRDGKILIQRKVSFDILNNTYPKKIPRFFTDIKMENYGFLNGQLKCVDYANVLCMLTGFMDKKMRTAKW